MKIFVRVKPNAKNEVVSKIDETHFDVLVKEPPVGGRANRAVMRALASHFGVPLFCVKILAGHTARNKIIEIVTP